MLSAMIYVLRRHGCSGNSRIRMFAVSFCEGTARQEVFL